MLPYSTTTHGVEYESEEEKEAMEKLLEEFCLATDPDWYDYK